MLPNSGKRKEEDERRKFLVELIGKMPSILGIYLALLIQEHQSLQSLMEREKNFKTLLLQTFS